MIYQRVLAHSAPRVRFGGPTQRRRRNAVVPLYHDGSANRCPSCGGTSFDVRRITAECAGCGEVLTIVFQRRSPPTVASDNE